MRGIIHWNPPPPPACDHAGHPLALYALANLLRWGVHDILLAAPPGPLADLQRRLADGSGEARCAYALLPADADPAAALFAGLEYTAGHACLLMSGMHFFSPGDWHPPEPKRGMLQITPNPAQTTDPALHCYAPTSLRPLLDLHRAGTPPNLAHLHAELESRNQLRRVPLPPHIRCYDGCAAPDSPHHPNNAPSEDLPQVDFA